MIHLLFLFLNFTILDLLLFISLMLIWLIYLSLSLGDRCIYILIYLSCKKRIYIYIILQPQHASQSRSNISSFQYSFRYQVNIKVFGGEPGPAATLAPKLGPLGLVRLHSFRMPKRSDKISLRKEENGKESELWFSWNAKTELLKSQSTPAHLPSSSRNSATMSVTERKSKTLTTREISLSSKLRKSLKSLRRNQWPKLSKEPSSKSWELAFPSGALWTSKILSKWLLRSTTVR